ncbi:MAG TPA: hypothetical protein ENJ60_08120 [Aeromonadales bacterium]|nr:hypothetical protein [Aeromonadales bacterium]
MKFVALMFAFVLGYLAQNGKHAVINEIRAGFEKYARWFEQRFTSIELSSGWGGLVMFALVPSVILGILIHIISGGFTLLLLILHALVLLVCLVPVEPEIRFNHESTDDKDDKRAEDIQSDFDIEQIVSIIFWYFVLGPLGALTVKLLFVGRQRTQIQQELGRLMFIINWLPGRLLILSYALVGNFHGVVSAVGNDIFKLDVNIQSLEQAAEKSALWPHFDELETDEAITQTAALYRRAIICWLAIIALISITL